MNILYRKSMVVEMLSSQISQSSLSTPTSLIITFINSKGHNSDRLWKCAAFGQVKINVQDFIYPRFSKTIRDTNLKKFSNVVCNLQTFR